MITNNTWYACKVPNNVSINDLKPYADAGLLHNVKGTLWIVSKKIKNNYKTEISFNELSDIYALGK